LFIGSLAEYQRERKAMKNAISWFEIPVIDLGRSQKFYEEIMGITFSKMDLPQLKMRLFPIDDAQGIGGSLVDSGGFHKPSATEGPLIYLNGNPDVQLILSKVEKAGGKIVVPKTQISPEFGYMCVILDTEGNRIAFHSIP
jgi:predicted enzyme related to lactoylglutathione lyase